MLALIEILIKISLFCVKKNPAVSESRSVFLYVEELTFLYNNKVRNALFGQITAYLKNIFILH